MEFTEFEQNVIEWAEERNIFEKANRCSQYDKTTEEVVELRDAISLGETGKELAKDAIGDIIVTLAIQAKMWNLSLMECCEKAWDEIKDRKGKMIDGQFVKE